jgi:hypothetical protein
MGVVAQTVEKVFPEAVSKDQNGYRSVAYTMLIAPIIESIKQLSSDFKSTVMRVLYLEERDREKDLLIASIKAENIALKNEFKSQALSHKNENELIMSKLKKIETILKNQ